MTKILPKEKEINEYDHSCGIHLCKGCLSEGFNDAIDLCQAALDKKIEEVASKKNISKIIEVFPHKSQYFEKEIDALCDYIKKGFGKEEG